MRGIYRSFLERRRLLTRRARTVFGAIEVREYIVASVGFATFFFGFLAGALLNLYLLAIHHPLVTQLRASLSYKSAIIGDGILLPIVNMIAVSFLLRNWEHATKKTVRAALVAGWAVTAWFHINQAALNAVNWAMPAPWHWNILGLWHAIYMFSVSSLLSLFGLVVMRVVRAEWEVPKETVFVTIGIVIFFFLLRLDYLSFNLVSLIPMLQMFQR